MNSGGLLKIYSYVAIGTTHMRATSMVLHVPAE
uniref:Uncharacterized protein n=1 Tax=Setaria viridis TaxID=4556 RepID=A0A4U6V5Q4_SETVI|nr:hypothetical protein SEVIR_4G215801v2 [Setaria viridis]